MSGLPKRIISAVVALIIFSLNYYYFGRDGLLIAGGLIFALGAFEFSQIVFSKDTYRRLKFLFLSFSFLLLILTIVSPPTLMAFWGVAVSSFIASCLWTLRNKVDNEKLLSILAVAVLGFVYCSLLPTFILRLLFLKDGVDWFVLLVAIVFAGDTFAFFGGILFGKSKLMPSLSPGKTIAGAVSGIVASGIAGLLVGHFLLSEYSLALIVITSVLASILAQNGDLFESLLKRVAGVKDSGKIMPGHGGVLDRLDGVYFAAPLIFCVAQYFYSV
jgi:phosphatidate cytidylyltransferase